MLKANDLDTLNRILDTNYSTEDDLHKYMKENKTECALKIFSAKDSIEYPEYIKRAIL